MNCPSCPKSQVLQSLAFRSPSYKAGKQSLHCDAETRPSVLRRPGWDGRRNVRGPSWGRDSDVEVRASRGREVASSRLGRRHAPPFSKERALALEIGGGGGRIVGNMGGCHLSATVLCAFNSADMRRRVSDQFGL